MNREQFLLIKLAEEAAEVAQIALKTAQFGMTEKHPDLAEDNRQRIFAELNDLQTIVEMLRETNAFDFRPDIEASMRKRWKVEKYFDYSVKLGMVSK